MEDYYYTKFERQLLGLQPIKPNDEDNVSTYNFSLINFKANRTMMVVSHYKQTLIKRSTICMDTILSLCVVDW